MFSQGPEKVPSVSASKAGEEEDDCLYFFDICPFWRERLFVDSPALWLLCLQWVTESASDALDEKLVSDSDKKGTRWSSLPAKFPTSPLLMTLFVLPCECGVFMPAFSTSVLLKASGWSSQSKLLVNTESRISW